MKTTVKIIKGRNKKYNNLVFTIENCEIFSETILFDYFEFNNKIYKGTINTSNNNMTIWFGRQSTIQFDEIQILN
jgi:hypothetical protein